MSLIEQLHDIEGLDPISYWPLSMGGWVCVFLGACFLIGFGFCLKRYIAYSRSWKKDTLNRLKSLEMGLSPENSAQTLVVLSEYLRRIALRRFPRKECAALMGKPWLEWLKNHDPKEFDWLAKGKLLIDIPYAKELPVVPVEQTKELIQAVRYWVH